jgi:hypothetical protein
MQTLSLQESQQDQKEHCLAQTKPQKECHPQQPIVHWEKLLEPREQGQPQAERQQEEDLKQV